MSDGLDQESAPLAGKKTKGSKNIEWGKFGLSEDQPGENGAALAGEGDGYQTGTGKEKIQELYDEQQGSLTSQKPWWKANFFVREPVLFGTWDGVFTSCMINIFGVVIFLRTGWVVGNAGIGLSCLIVVLTVLVALIAALAAIGVCERCHVESGGVYFLVSKVLGARIGGAIGMLYVFGQTVACALYCTGFGESIAETFNWENTWAVRGVGIATILLLLAVNIAGVKWVVKMQLILLAVLGIATLDFLVGTFAQSDHENGVLGFNSLAFTNNSGPSYLEGENFFTVFGVFFPTATGVMAGINMSGDLRNPKKSIPYGTLSALGVTTVLYLLFVLLLGATCARWALQEDYMIAEKVSLVGFLWLMGLYISSLSSCLGGLYGAPRILQCIANENVIPIIKVLGHGKGPNKEPIFASLVVCFVAILFIFIGHVNELGPIVTMPFLVTYAAMDYAYFSLAMSYDKEKSAKSKKEKDSLLAHVINKSDDKTTYGALKAEDAQPKDDALREFKEDIDKAERMFPKKDMAKPGGGSGVGGDYDGWGEKNRGAGDGPVDVSDKEGLIDSTDSQEKQDNSRPFGTVDRMPASWYSRFCNRWVSFIGILAALVIMFAIQWGYALANVSVYLILYIYIGQANPGVYPGISEFKFFQWIKSLFTRLCRTSPPPEEQMVVHSQNFVPQITTEQLTEDNQDFASRGRYHQSMVNNANFDDFEYGQEQ
ncbi:solute carrier family 12 member 8-like isoform X2 [Acanthaster planci]|uniref:Solute carrier family 12 member 8 n=1 Tax=Acanthaster planci TaxID=133434 RepID=A0A8B7YCT6_ACAPL|nr:solute carrier family 12 member 8-like isoform X2 [Acanthaster planci]